MKNIKCIGYLRNKYDPFSINALPSPQLSYENVGNQSLDLLYESSIISGEFFASLVENPNMVIRRAEIY